MISAGFNLWYTCGRCGYSGHRIATLADRTVSEAWGVRRVEVELTPICPECGSDKLDCELAGRDRSSDSMGV